MAREKGKDWVHASHFLTSQPNVKNGISVCLIDDLNLEEDLHDHGNASSKGKIGGLHISQVRVWEKKNFIALS